MTGAARLGAPARLALVALVLLPLAACGKKAPLRPPSDDRRPAAPAREDGDAPETAPEEAPEGAPREAPDGGAGR